MSLNYEILELAALRHDGVITEEEYNLRKSLLLKGHILENVIGTNRLSQKKTIEFSQTNTSRSATKPVPDTVPLSSQSLIPKIVTQPHFRTWKHAGIIFVSTVFIAILFKFSGLFTLPLAVADKNTVPTGTQQIGTKNIPQEDVQNLIDQWLNSWKSGDMEAYRRCYAIDFRGKGKDLNAWISYKANTQKKSKNINIAIDHLQVSQKGNNATAVFIQSYSSSIVKDSGRKTLALRKINDEWKIYREIM